MTISLTQFESKTVHNFFFLDHMLLLKQQLLLKVYGLCFFIILLHVYNFTLFVTYSKIRMHELLKHCVHVLLFSNHYYSYVVPSFQYYSFHVYALFCPVLLRKQLQLYLNKSRKKINNLYIQIELNQRNIFKAQNPSLTV